MNKSKTARARWAELRARASHAEFLDAEREHALLAQAKSGDARAVSRLVGSHMRLVVDVASHYARADLDPDDLISEGTLGLLEAIRRFDAGHDARLAAYGRWWIRARVHAYAREQRNLVSPPSTRLARKVSRQLRRVEHQLVQRLGRAPTHAELAVALETSEHELAWLIATRSVRDVGLDDLPSQAAPRTQAGDPEQELVRQQLRSAMRAALSQLTRRERRVFSSQFPDAQCTHAELGAQLGLSRQRASQLVAQVRERLRDELASLAS